MPYSYDPIFAADPSNAANVAANASIIIFDPNDPGKAPVTITDVTGSPLPNPITVNKNGFGPAFQHATLDRVGWFGAGFTGYFTSYEGMKAEAVEAKEAAQTAAVTAGVDAALHLDELIAAGGFEGPAGPLTNLTIGTVETTAGNPLTDDIVASEVLYGVETTAALSAKIGTQIDATKGVELAPMATVDHPAGVVLKSAYDPRTRSYNLNQSTLSKARAAHARGLTGGKPMQLHFLMHSYGTGFQSAAPYPTNTSPAQVTRALDASGRVGKVAEGHRVFTYGSTLGARLSDDTRFTIPAEWTYISGHGYALASVYRNIANTGDLVFTPGVPVTHFEIVYLASTVTGAWSFSIDGGSFASTGITATNPTIGYFSRITAASAEPALHTLTIRPPTSGHVMIQSVRAYTDTATIKNAIEVTNAAQSGSTAAGATVGSWTHSLAGYASTAQAIAFYKPDLACIMLGTNDRNAGYTKEAYINAMRTLANQVKSAGGDVIFLREPTPTEQGFTDGLYGLADEIGAGIIEVGPDWPTTYANAKAEPYGYIGVDNGHPSPRGHTAIARAVSSALISAL